MKSERYGWSESTAPHTSDYVNTAVLRTLASHKVERILDLGSGNGALCGQLADHGYQVEGLEGDKDGLLIARQTYPGIVFHHADIESDSSHKLTTNAPFDAVVSTEVIEHLYQPRKLIALANEMLKDDGIIVISTPYHGYLKNLTLALCNKFDKHLDPLWDGGHIKFWSRNTLSKVLEEYDFKILNFIGAGRVYGLWKSMILVGIKSASK